MTVLDTIREKARPILEKHGVSRAEIFGSYARGDADEGSDIDILVEVDEDSSLLDFIELKQELEDELGTAVDLIEYGTVKPQLREHVMKHRVAIV